ncbi:MAG TPA: hypothetical protein VKU01_08150 [Bryobacteraceae bacterium]|nr:hypothetical protein [Bryobacteraceae bacterium]
MFDGITGTHTGQLTPAGGWGTPSGIAVASDGRVYVADFDNNVVYRFSAAGVYTDTFISSNLFEPTGLAFGPDGFLYVANFGAGNNSYVVRFKPDGTPVDATPFVPSSTGLFDPGAIVFGRDGNLYIADSSNAAIDRVTSGGVFSTLVPAGCPTTPFTNPQGITFGSDQQLYVSDAGFGCGINTGSGVYKYSTFGVLLGTFIAPNVLSTPIDLAFGPDGNLYVTDGQGRVARFDGTTGAARPDFVPSGGAGGPLINPTFLAFNGQAAATITVTGGSNQSTLINTQFASRLAVRVTDLAGNPVPGVTVVFTAPPQGGPSATFTGGNTAITNALGVATSNVVVANGHNGGPYTVVASTGSALPANFNLSNTFDLATVPALSAWGLGGLALALAILAVFIINRRMSMVRE